MPLTKGQRLGVPKFPPGEIWGLLIAEAMMYLLAGIVLETQNLPSDNGGRFPLFVLSLSPSSTSI